MSPTPVAKSMSGKVAETTTEVKAYVLAHLPKAQRTPSPPVTRSVSGRVAETTSEVKSYVQALSLRAYARAQEVKATTVETASKPQVQVTAASAAAGAVTLGTAGGAAGVMTGGIIGAAVGVIPALFTFGLSIPVCAVVGATVGGGTGVAVGGTTGIAAGGCAGYYGYAHKDEISDGVAGACKRVDGYQKLARGKVCDSASLIGGKVNNILGRTGGA